MQRVTKIYEITSTFPHEEKYGLVSLIRRSAISVPSKITEDYGRNSHGEFKSFFKYFVVISV